MIGNMASTMLTGLGGSGHAEGTTQSAVADGTIIINDSAHQQQDVGTLSRDTEHANGSIDPIFNKEKEQRRLQTAQLLGEIGRQVSDIVRTDAKIRATENANARMEKATPADRADAIKTLEKDKKAITEEAISGQMYQTFYNDAFAKSEQGTGGQYQRAITAATAAIQAIVGGDIKGALAGAAAPYIANEIAQAIPETNRAGRVLAHAIVNAALAAASGKDAGTAAAGAATGELAGMIALDAWGKTVDQLSEEEKQTVSALATLASGLAGGLVGDSGANAVAGAQAGKTVVENNALSLVVQGGKLAVQGCTKVAACRNALVEKGLGALLGIGVAETALDNLSASEQQYVLGVAMSGRADLIDALTPEQRAAYDYIVEQDKQGSFSLLPAQQSSTGEASSKPNVSKDLTNEERAEIGGSGSGTPGGWEPQDEENARNQQSSEVAKKDVEKLGYDTNKVSHIFADKHQMSSLIEEFGSQEAALKEMHNVTQSLAKNPGSYQTGSWVTVRVGNSNVSVKGIVINGEFRISTATMRPF